MSGQTWSLPRDFFDKNKRESHLPTAGEFSFFQMEILFNGDLNNVISDYVSTVLDPDRIEEIEERNLAIDALSTPEELIRTMKKRLDPANRERLCKKALEMGDDATEMIIGKLRTNGLDRFIECAMLVLSRVDEKYIDQVAEEFRQFRNGYARTQAAVLLAYRERKDVLKNIYDEYMQMARSNDPDDRRNAESVLFAIHILAEKN